MDSIENFSTHRNFGTLFTILHTNGQKHKNITGHNVVLCGYCLYGVTTKLVFGRNGYNELWTYSLHDSKFHKTVSAMQLPAQGKHYFIDESKREQWSSYYIHKLTNELRTSHTHSYSNSILSDLHEILLQGGIYINPVYQNDKNNHCYIFHYAYPIAKLLENSGGQATDGETSIIDLPYSSVKKTQLIFGGTYEMKTLQNTLAPKLLYFD